MKSKRDTKRGIYLLPNLFTTATLFAGFYAIVAANHQHYSSAAIAIFIAMLMDSMDGRIARLLGTQSDFGAQFDSMADMVAFGVAPALVAYQWALSDLGKVGWLLAFFFTASAALRLARFNSQSGVETRSFFQGLSSPAGAGILIGLIWVCDVYEITGSSMAYLLACVVIFVGALMVSNVRYHSFKEVDLGGRVPFVAVLAIVMAFILISYYPSQVLFTILLTYGLSGPLCTLWHLRRRHLARRNKDKKD